MASPVLTGFQIRGRYRPTAQVAGMPDSDKLGLFEYCKAVKSDVLSLVAFGGLDHFVQKRCRDAVKVFSSKWTVQLAHVSIQEFPEEAYHEVFHVFLPYLA